MFWSDEDEAQVLAQWDTDSAAKPLKRPNSKEQYIWRTSVRFLRCLPTELIGMRYGLEYDTEEATSQNWTEPFCNRLVKIIAHPISANNPAKIALAIKFSVCSWKRLKWVIPSHNDLFLQTVKDVAEERDEMVGAELVRDSILEWRDTWPEEPELPPWAHLLKAIVARGKQPVSAAESPHRVGTKHLSAIVDSLDEITHGKLVTYHSVDVYERALKDIRANVDLPTNKDPVDQLMAEGIIHNRRLQVLRERHPNVADIYKRVSLPVASRPVPKLDAADIYDDDDDEDESSEAEEQSEAEAEEQPEAGGSEARGSEARGQSEAAQPAQPAQANPPAKRKRGRPRKTENAPNVEAAVDAGPSEQVDDGGEAPPVKRRPGRPRKNVAPVAPAPVAPAPVAPDPVAPAPVAPALVASASQETTASPRPNAADDAASGGSKAHVVPAPGGRGKQNRTRTPSVPESIANAGEKQLALPSRGVTPNNGDAGDDAFYFGDDDGQSEHEIASPLVSLPQRMSSLLDARPGTSRSEELGDAPVGEVGTDERGTDEVTPNEPGTIPSQRSVGEAILPSADVASLASGGDTIEIPFVAPAGFNPELPADRVASDSIGPRRPFAFYTSYRIPEAPPEEADWFVPGGSSLPAPSKEPNKPSAPVSASKKTIGHRRPIDSPTPEEQMRRLQEEKQALASRQGKSD